MKIILTGTKGFVGEGVLMECLNDKSRERAERGEIIDGAHS